jgi:hypothetical protein
MYLPFPLGVWTAAEFDSLCSSCSPWIDLLTLAPSYPGCFVLPSSGSRPIVARPHCWQGRRLCWGRVAGSSPVRRSVSSDKRLSLYLNLASFRLAVYFILRGHLAFLLVDSICIGKYQVIKRYHC